MAFKLPNRPSPRPNAHELADFAELLALTRGKCSATEIQRYLGRLDDNQENVGLEDDDEENEKISDGMIVEIGFRMRACPDGYPFQTDTTGSILEPRDDVDPLKVLLYRYLLMATRLKMKGEKIQSGIDGTQLLEELGARVLRSYLGETRACAEVFGTARQGGFADKVTALCRSLLEGGRFRNLNSGPLNPNDDGIDVVGWIPFTDTLPGKICVFAQCKTGTSWRDKLSKLDPAGFVKKWMSDSIMVDPLKAFIIAESADRGQWHSSCIDGGILFDRCRILDFSQNLDEELVGRISTWTEAAMNRLSDWSWAGT